MARNIEVNLLFQANTAQAVNNMNQLGQLLNKISTKTTIGVDGGSIQKAVASARELQIQLEKAVNVETGKLNLSTLNKNLKESGQSLNTLAANLQGAGVTGQQAFIKLANAVSQAEVPMIRVNQRLKNFGTTLLNTVKWQLASNAIHAVSGMLTSAVSHAERLNTALNDIRIVTGYNVNTMAEFAEQASRAAKQLGTTSEEYAKASLIFYQQGLTGKDVTDRADVVTKMMKVTGQSAEVVSSQMTAIWNNFAKAGDNLESYADKLTKLGAATAASTDEISDGLEKFAAVADTVGLSYDYAAASVAAVVAQTRQSADVVGTAFKTIFARLQDLKLGDTLDDGTTLGQYSENLAKVGVNIQTADGQLKDMNVILEETAAKWEMLDKGQQVALAKGVAGIRQYNQFIALMDNWDFVQDNVELAENATGELTAQFDIWAEGYEGAAARVKQAQQNLYENFINDEDIVTLNNLFADLINGISDTVDAFGGIGPIVLTLVGLFSQTLFPLIINGFKNLGNIIGVWSGSAMTQVTTMQQQMSQQMLDILNNNNNLNESTRTQIVLSQKLLETKQQLALASKSMTTEEKAQAESHMQVYESLQAQIQAILEKKAALENEIAVIKESLDVETKRSTKRSMAAAGIANKAKLEPGADEDKIDRQMTKALYETEGSLKKQIANATEKSKTADQATKDVLAAQIKDLQQILEYRKQINSESNKKTTDINVGKASSGFIDEDQTKKQQSYTNAMGKDIAKQMGDSSTYDDGSLNMNTTNITNLENLYNIMGQYKTQLQEVNAVSQDFSNAQKTLTDLQKQGVDVSAEIKKGYENMNSSIQTVKKAEQNYAKTKKEVIQAETKYGKASKEASSARVKMQAASRNLETAEKKLIKVQKQQSKSFQEIYQAQQPLLNSKDKVMAWAQSVGMSEDEVKKLDAAYDDFINSGDISKLSNISNFIKDMGIASSNSIEGILGLAENMRNLLLEAGFAPEQIDPLIKKFQDLANSAGQVQGRVNEAISGFEKFKNGLANVGAGFGNVLGSVAKFAGQMSMATAGFNSLMSAFDAGNTPMQTMTNLLMGATMILPILSGAFKKLKADKEQDTLATLANLFATEALTNAEGKITAATWLGNAARAVKVILEDKWVGLGLVAVALGIAGAIAIQSKKQEEQNEKLKEANELKTEEAKKSKEQAEANTELLKSYNDLLQTYKETGEGKEELDNAAQKLAEAYDIEGAALARLTGNYADYKKVSDAAYEANKKELDNLLSEQEAALKINVDKVFEAAWDVGNQTDEADGNFRVTLDGKADQSAVFKYFDQDSEFFKGIRGNDDIDFELKNYEQNPEKFIEFYDYLKNAYNEMSKDEKATKYDSYTDLKELIAVMADPVETARENYDEVKKLKLLLGKTEATEGFGDELQEVDTISEYIDWVNRLEKSLTDAKYSQDDINDAIKIFTDETTNSAIKSLKYYKDYIDDIKEKHEIGDEIESYFAGLSDEDKELFLNIKFDVYKTKEEWDKQLEFLRNQAVMDDLKIESDTVKATKELIKEEDMTEDDWIKVRDAGIEWGKYGILEFNKFLQLSYEQQLEYLNELNKIYTTNRKEILKESKEALKNELEQLYKDRSKATDPEDYKALTTEIERILSLINTYDAQINIIEQQELNEIQTLYDTLESLQDITVGDYITQDQYDLLVQYNKELASYFQLTSKGYQMIGNPLDLLQEFQKIQLDTVETQYTKTAAKIKDKKDELKELNTFVGMDYVSSAASGYNFYNSKIDEDEINRQKALLGEEGNNYIFDVEKFNNNLAKGKTLTSYLNSAEVFKDDSDYWGEDGSSHRQTGTYEDWDLYWRNVQKANGNFPGNRDHIKNYDYYNMPAMSYNDYANRVNGLSTLYNNGQTDLTEEQFNNIMSLYATGAYNNLVAQSTEMVVSNKNGDLDLDRQMSFNSYSTDAVGDLINFVGSIDEITEGLEADRTEIAGQVGLVKYQASDLANAVNDKITQANATIPQEISDLTIQLQKDFVDKLELLSTSAERNQTLLDYEALTGQKINLQANENGELEDPLAQTYLQQATSAIEKENMENLDINEVEAYSHYLEDLAFTSGDITEKNEETEEQFEDVAAAIMKMNRGAETLNSNWEEWGDILKKSSKNSQEYFKTLNQTKTAMSDLLGVSEEFISDNFIATNLDLIGEAAQGSEEAISSLGTLMATSILTENINLAEGITFELNGEKFTYVNEEIDTLMQEISNKIKGDGIKIGEGIDVSDDLFNQLTGIVEASQMTMEQANAFYRSMGFTPVYETVTVEQGKTVPLTATLHNRDIPPDGYDEYGNPIKWTDYEEVVSNEQADGGMFESQLNAMTMKTADGEQAPTPEIKVKTNKVVKLNRTGGGPVDLGGGGGSNKGSGPKSGKAKKKDDVIKRYKEVDDAIEKHQRKLKQLETEEAGLYGKDKINSMYKRVEIAELENKELEEKIRQTREFLGLDRQNLQKALSDTGLGLQFEFSVDENGFETISNYTPVMEQLYNKYKSVYNEYTGGQEGVDLTEDQEKEIKKWEDLMDEVNEYYEQYEETSNLLYDQLQEDREKDLKRQEDYFTALNDQLENSLEIETEQLDYIERKLALIADDCFELAEGLGLMLGSFNEDGSWDNEGSQYGYLKSQKADLEAWRTDLETAYASGKINYNQYMEGMKTLRDMALSNAEAVKEFDTAMMEYYENSINKITEKFSRLSDLQEHNIGMLDHMQSVVELLGKSADPRNLTAIVNAQKDVAKNNLEESEAWFDVMKEQAEFKKNEYDKKYADLAADGMTEEDWQILEGFEKEWLAAQEAANEAEDQMYSDFETWLEKTKEATKNAVDVANKQWEKNLLASMFGEKNPYASFEDVTLALDRQKSLQEDILDVTNKKYETDKLIRKVQQDIDKSTNSVAKKELKAFTERIKAKQDQTTLSEIELGILEKEYELLQAKIALEEAQNAKSTVRLQRDSEGNFGYIYTADQDKVANAEQAYLDADNALYNARLEAADDYGEKYIQAQQELYNTITEIDQAWQDGEYASYDEYLAARKAAFDHYEKLIVQYQGIYNNIFADNASWITDFTTDESRRLTGNVIDDVEGLEKDIYADSQLMSGHIINSAGMMSSAWEKNMQNMDSKTSGWKTSTDGYLKEVSGYFTKLQGDIKTEIETSGSHFTAFKDLITPINKTSKDSIDSLAIATGSVVTQSGNLTTMLTKEDGLIKALDTEMNSIANVTTNYQLHRKEVVGLAGEYATLAENINSAILAQQKEKNWNESKDNNSTDSQNNNNNNNSNSNTNAPTGGNGTKWFGNATWERGVEVYELIHTYGALGNGIQNRIAEGAKRGYNQDEVLLGQSIIDNVYPIDKNGQGMAWEDAKKRLGFDTGGYTGEWDGGYGKLAFLHSKELVLNQGDTANFLASMELLDSIIKTIDLYSANAQWGGMLSTPTFGPYGSEPIQQNITIEAHFPDATDRNEIEEAFKSLGNLASQYITKY